MKKNLQVLAVTMHQNDHNLLKKMNIQSDAMIGNQTDYEGKSVFQYEGHRIEWFDWDEKGVGLNRNNLLMRASADIILFADDDVIYEDNYSETILKSFAEHPEADMIIFNVIPMPESINPCRIKKWHRIRWYNCLRYGAVRIAVRLSALRKYNVFFTLLFGGGAKYSSGEDSLFIMDCIKRGMKIYGYPADIGKVYFETSSWFKGYNKKYFQDKGVFFYFLSNHFSRLLCLQYCMRCSNQFSEYYSVREAYELMLNGIKKYKREIRKR